MIDFDQFNRLESTRLSWKTKPPTSKATKHSCLTALTHQKNIHFTISKYSFINVNNRTRNNLELMSGTEDRNRAENQRNGIESVLESFVSGSSSEPYTPSPHVLIDNALSQPENLRNDAVVALLREQTQENANLNVTISELGTTIADLRNQLHEVQSKIARKEDS